MTLTVHKPAVTRDDYARMRQRQTHHVFRNAVDHNRAALFPVLRESLRGEAFARSGPLKIAVRDPETLLPAFVEYRAFELRLAGGIRVAFGGDVEAALLRAVDHLEGERRLPERHARDVDDVQRCSGDSCVADHLLKRVNYPRVHGSRVAHMNVNRGVALRGQAENVENLFASGLRHVSNAHADSQRMLIEADSDGVESFGYFTWRRGARDGIVAR